MERAEFTCELIHLASKNTDLPGPIIVFPSTASCVEDIVCALVLPEQLTAVNVNPEVNQQPLVSIIIPCYNGAAYLEEALLSALAQSYAEVEVLVVDDGSTDASPEITQRFPVRYIRQQNRGKSEARNLGIKECNGAYILFLDADDRLKPQAIESGLRAMERHPDCAFAVGDHVFISGDGSYLSPSKKVATLHSHYEALLTSNFIEMISSVLFRRSIFDELGGFDRNLSVAEDYELYLRIARVRPVCSHSTVVAEYRKHKGNISLNSELMLTTTLLVLSGQAKYVGNDAGRRRAFRKGLRSWRRQYGRQLASELAACFSTMVPDQRRRKLRLLADHYPQGLAILFLLRMLPSLGRHQPASYSTPKVSLWDRSGAVLHQQLISNLVVTQEEAGRTPTRLSR
jgi:glycosyltransferase involved in cell wall biosynthesis